MNEEEQNKTEGTQSESGMNTEASNDGNGNTTAEGRVEQHTTLGNETPGEPRKALSSGSRKRGTIIAVIIAIIIIIIAICVALFETGNFGPVSGFFTGHKAVAYVNGQKITQGELASRFAPLKQRIETTSFATTTNKQTLIAKTKKQVLDSMINERILEAEAKKADTTVTASEVQSQYQTSEQQYATQQKLLSAEQTASSSATTSKGSAVATTTFEEYLQDNGYTEEQFKAQLRTQILISKYLEKKLDLKDITVTDQEAQDLYDTYKNQSSDSSQVPDFKDIEASLKAQIQKQKAQSMVQDYVKKARAGAEVKVLI